MGRGLPNIYASMPSHRGMRGGFRSSKLAVIGFRLFFLGINRWACWAPMVPATLRAESLTIDAAV